MTELKTLKDFYFKQPITIRVPKGIKVVKIPIHIGLCNGVKLRREAIKHIEELRKKNRERRYFRVVGKKRARWVLEQLSDTELILWIKNFFNLTDEDLK